MTSYMIKHSKLMPKSQKKQNFVDRVTRYGYFRKWHPLKQTKTKNGRHFFISTFDNFQLCFFVQKDSFTLKVLKMQFVFGTEFVKQCRFDFVKFFLVSTKDKLHF